MALLATPSDEGNEAPHHRASPEAQRAFWEQQRRQLPWSRRLARGMHRANSHNSMGRTKVDCPAANDGNGLIWWQSLMCPQARNEAGSTLEQTRTWDERLPGVMAVQRPATDCARAGTEPSGFRARCCTAVHKVDCSRRRRNLAAHARSARKALWRPRCKQMPGAAVVELDAQS